MKYFGKQISEDKIVAKVLEDPNAWEKLSNFGLFTVEEVYKYYEHIDIRFFYKKLINKNYYSREDAIKMFGFLLDKNVFSNNFQLIKTVGDILKIDKDFIINHKNALSTYIIFHTKNVKFTKKEIIENKLIRLPVIGEQVKILTSKNYHYEITDIDDSMETLTLRKLDMIKIKDSILYRSNVNGSSKIAKLNSLGFYTVGYDFCIFE